MSMHFAPQWVKPIKPTGSSTTPVSDTPPHSAKSISNNPMSGSVTSSATSSHPFPALSSSTSHRSASPTTAVPPTLSYSRITHAPQSPSVPGDGSYFPFNGDVNGEEAKHPFRYSREQILGVYDEDKVRDVPIELVEVLEGGGVLVQKGANRPVGLRELTDDEKKILATTVHPAMPVRRAVQSNANGEAQGVNGSTPSRRPTGSIAKDGTAPARGTFGGTFGAFGRGEGGALGKSTAPLMSPTAEGRAPGALGGGFGGVPKRPTARGRTDSADGLPVDPAVARQSWRQSRGTSGNFEGVLGFGGPAAPTPAAEAINEEPDPNPAQDPESAPSRGWREKTSEASREKVEEKRDDTARFGTGGGPGWGSGPKRWRLAAAQSANGAPAEHESVLEVPRNITDHPSDSVVATASATPLPERDATVQSTYAGPVELHQPPAMPDPQPSFEDLGNVQWYYRDPNGQQQGPFSGSQMHDWYTHSYFEDNLPLRRESETGYHSLAELKNATGNAVQPFLAPVKPRLPPNLPLPNRAFPPPPPISNGHTPVLDNFRNLSIQSPQAHQQFQQFNSGTPVQQGFGSPAAYSPFGPPGPISPQQQPWGAIGPQPSFMSQRFGPVGVPSPIGSAPLFGGHALGSPSVAEPHNGLFSPSVGVGAVPASPWAVPQPTASSFPPAPQQNYSSAPQSAWEPIHESPARPVAIDVQDLPPAEEASSQDVEQLAANVENEVAETIDEVIEEALSPPPEPATAPAATSPKSVVGSVTRTIPVPLPSVWGQKPIAVTTTETPAPEIATAPQPVRKTSLPVAPASAQLPATPIAATLPPASSATKLPPAPASLPRKPSVLQDPVSASSDAGTVVKTADKASTTASLPPKPAPWAAAKDEKEGKPATPGPSLREIQQLEAKQAEARKLALAEARAAASASASPAVSSTDEIPSVMSWGLPQQGQKATTPSVSTPPAATPPAWGSGDAGPKKTLKQIQEEEEKRKSKVAAAAKAAQIAAGVSAQPKRGYADLAANPTAAPAAAGWATVGANGKTVPGMSSSPARPAAPTATTVKPVVSPVPQVKPTVAANGTSKAEPAAPSVEFIKWTKSALTGLNAGTNVDDLVQMLLAFPVDPPAADRAGLLEIISDTVYANSTTLNGTRFAQEFFTRRKADAARPVANGSPAKVVRTSSLADVVKTQPKKTEDLGFKVVKPKGKKKN